MVQSNNRYELQKVHDFRIEGVKMSSDDLVLLKNLA